MKYFELIVVPGIVKFLQKDMAFFENKVYSGSVKYIQVLWNKRNTFKSNQLQKLCHRPTSEVYEKALQQTLNTRIGISSYLFPDRQIFLSSVGRSAYKVQNRHICISSGQVYLLIHWIGRLLILDCIGRSAYTGQADLPNWD